VTWGSCQNMPSKYKRDPGSRKYKDFSDESVQKAMDSVIRTKVSIRKAAEKYNITKSTLHRKLIESSWRTDCIVGGGRVSASTGWGKIFSLLSVGHCEGRGGRRRVGLGSKGAGSWEVPVTTLPSCKYGVVQRAARICRRNLLFAKSLYRSGATCVPYSLPNPPSGPSTRPKIHSVVG